MLVERHRPSLLLTPELRISYSRFMTDSKAAAFLPAAAAASEHPNEVQASGLTSELFYACAGPLVALPPVGSLVVYFPQGHLEQLAPAGSAAEFSAGAQQYVRQLHPHLLCRLVNVTFHAAAETEEVFARLTLQPVDQGEVSPEERTRDDLKQPEEHRPKIMFCKLLSVSDTSTHGGFSVPRRAAETCLPPLNYSQQPPAQALTARDLHGNEWNFRHIYRGFPKRHLLTTGWSNYVSTKSISAGDFVLFIRSEEGDLRIGIRRSVRHRGQPITGRYNSVLPAGTTALDLLRPVVDAVVRKIPFTVSYNPRAGQSPFVIPYRNFQTAIEGPAIYAGLRFKMAWETEEATSRRFRGTVVGLQHFDETWHNSFWRSLQVSWDEAIGGERQTRVSPWEIEPLVAPTASPLEPAVSFKRTRGNAGDTETGETSGGVRGPAEGASQALRSQERMQPAAAGLEQLIKHRLVHLHTPSPDGQLGGPSESSLASQQGPASARESSQSEFSKMLKRPPAMSPSWSMPSGPEAQHVASRPENAPLTFPREPSLDIGQLSSAMLQQKILIDLHAQLESQSSLRRSVGGNQLGGAPSREPAAAAPQALDSANSRHQLGGPSDDSIQLLRIFLQNTTAPQPAVQPQEERVQQAPSLRTFFPPASSTKGSDLQEPEASNVGTADVQTNSGNHEQGLPEFVGWHDQHERQVQGAPRQEQVVPSRSATFDVAQLNASRSEQSMSFSWPESSPLQQTSSSSSLGRSIEEIMRLGSQQSGVERDRGAALGAELVPGQQNPFHAANNEVDYTRSLSLQSESTFQSRRLGKPASLSVPDPGWPAAAGSGSSNPNISQPSTPSGSSGPTLLFGVPISPVLDRSSSPLSREQHAATTAMFFPGAQPDDHEGPATTALQDSAQLGDPGMMTKMLSGSSSGSSRDEPRGRSEMGCIKVYKASDPVGRKLDITELSGYQDLQQAISHLFQMDMDNLTEEFRMVYIDHEGDIVHVGDEPWSGFVANVVSMELRRR